MTDLRNNWPIVWLAVVAAIVLGALSMFVKSALP